MENAGRIRGSNDNCNSCSTDDVITRHPKKMSTVMTLKDWGFSSDKCHVCGLHTSEIDNLLMQCGKCKMVYYCSTKCFNSDLVEHQKICGTAKLRRQPEATITTAVVVTAPAISTNTRTKTATTEQLSKECSDKKPPKKSKSETLRKPKEMSTMLESRSVHVCEDGEIVSDSSKSSKKDMKPKKKKKSKKNGEEKVKKVKKSKESSNLDSSDNSSSVSKGTRKSKKSKDSNTLLGSSDHSSSISKTKKKSTNKVSKKDAISLKSFEIKTNNDNTRVNEFGGDDDDDVSDYDEIDDFSGHRRRSFVLPTQQQDFLQAHTLSFMDPADAWEYKCDESFDENSIISDFSGLTIVVVLNDESDSDSGNMSDISFDGKALLGDDDDDSSNNDDSFLWENSSNNIEQPKSNSRRPSFHDNHVTTCIWDGRRLCKNPELVKQKSIKSLKEKVKRTKSNPDVLSLSKSAHSRSGLSNSRGALRKSSSAMSSNSRRKSLDIADAKRFIKIKQYQQHEDEDDDEARSTIPDYVDLENIQLNHVETITKREIAWLVPEWVNGVLLRRKRLLTGPFAGKILGAVEVLPEDPDYYDEGDSPPGEVGAVNPIYCEGSNTDLKNSDSLSKSDHRMNNLLSSGKSTAASNNKQQVLKQQKSKGLSKSNHGSGTYPRERYDSC